MEGAHLPVLLIFSIPHLTITLPETLKPQLISTSVIISLLGVSLHNQSNKNDIFASTIAKMFARLELLAACLITASAVAAPSPASGSMTEDFEWRIKTGNYSLPNSHTLPKRSMDCSLNLPK